MIARTNNFKEEIAKLGREIDFKIELYTNDKIITQNNKFLMTQDNMHLVVEQFNEEEVDEVIGSENIYNVSVVRKGNLLSTMMKEVDFEIKEDLRIGDIIDCSFGLKVGNNYEYINYGKYIIYSKEHNEDTDTYSYVSYDSMLFSMVEVDNTSIIQGVTVKKAIENICDKVGLTVNITAEDIENLPNLNKVINENTFTDIKMTYRDVLDIICQCLGVTIVSNGKVLYLKTLDDTIVDTFDEKYLKDINVKFSEKYGPINSVVLSRSEDNDTIYRKDEESIALNGLHEFKIKDNLIMLYDDREDYIDEIFDQLNGTEYYINDFSSTGITYLEPLDFYNINIGENIYKCLLLNDEIKVQQGLEESIYTEIPKETTTDYKTSSKTDKEVSFIVDKQNGEIKARVTQDEMESYVTQVANEINAQVSEKVGDDEIIAKLNLAVRDGQGIVNLTGNTVTINSDKFKLDADGKITATGGTIGGYTIDSTSLSVNVRDKYTYTSNDIQILQNILQSGSTPTQEQLDKYDIDENGILNSADLLWLQRKVNGYSPTSGTFKITGENTRKVITTTGNISSDTILTEIGLESLKSNFMNCYSLNITGGISLNSNNQSKINMYASDGSITCVSLTQTSEEKHKKNFEKLENALDIIKNTDIYKYNLKTEEDNDKKHIGFVIGDNYNYSKEITSKDNDGADIYSFVSVCCKAIQEQQEQIEELKKEIKSLKEGDK